MTKSETETINETKLQLEAANVKTEAATAQNKAIQSELGKHMGLSHERLASQVALLKKHLNRASAKNKSVESLTNEYKERTENSLKDDLTELLAELDWSPKADPTSTPIVLNPLAVNKEQIADTIHIEETEDDDILWFNGKAAKKPEFTKAMEALDAQLARLKQG